MMTAQAAARDADPKDTGLNPVGEAPGAPSDRPLDTSQFTLRAVLTGMFLGGTLSLCNLYAGLKVGWGFNMSLTSALLALGFWTGAKAVAGARPFTLLENNVNQTAASAGASISSAGLVSSMPALAILTGQTLGWMPLALWTFAVSSVGIVVAISLRRQMILVDKLPFASGVAAAEALREMYARGAEAAGRIKMLLGGALFAGSMKVLDAIVHLPKIGVPGAFSLTTLEGARRVTPYNLSFAFDPSLLLFAVGGIVGFRIGVSILLGAIVGWGVLASYALSQGWIAPGANDAMWYGNVLQWLLWPGVAMMTTAALTSFAFSWKSVLAALRGRKGAAAEDEGDVVSRSALLKGLFAAGTLAVVLQMVLFDILFHVAVLGVLFTFLLAVVAARVSGETSITPVGPMGKVTQLLFGVIAPASPAANLMTATVTGGAASQCGDLLHDLKTGHLIGASARLQAMAQVLGVISGAIVASGIYLVLIPDPKNQLFTPEWPAPAAAAWKAVAELFMKGFESMPQGALAAMVWAGIAGIVLAVLEKVAPKKVRTWVPSPASMGLALVIPAYNSVSMFLGGTVALLAVRYVKTWAGRFLLVLASGIIAGESLTGVGVAIVQMLGK